MITSQQELTRDLIFYSVCVSDFENLTLKMTHLQEFVQIILIQIIVRKQMIRIFPWMMFRTSSLTK